MLSVTAVTPRGVVSVDNLAPGDGGEWSCSSENPKSQRPLRTAAESAEKRLGIRHSEKALISDLFFSASSAIKSF
jgi:hypothetical protein